MCDNGLISLPLCPQALRWYQQVVAGQEGGGGEWFGGDSNNWGCNRDVATNRCSHMVLFEARAVHSRAVSPSPSLCHHALSTPGSVSVVCVSVVVMWMRRGCVRLLVTGGRRQCRRQALTSRQHRFEV
jgi:hypothetical protein